MKSPRSAFPTWSTYVPDVGPAPGTGSANYAGIAATMYARRGGSGFQQQGDLSRAGAVAAQQLSTAAGIGAGVVQQISHRPIMTALERRRAQWDHASDVGDRPRAPGERRGEVQGPPNVPGDVGTRVGWVPETAETGPPKTVTIGGETIDIEAFNARGRAAQMHARQGSEYAHAAERATAPELRSPPHGNPAASDMAQKTRSAVGAAADAVLSNPNLNVTTTRRRKSGSD